jgi:hypothetical protein
MKVLLYLVLLAVLAGLVWQWPMLWELAVAGAIGGVYWIFFRIPPSADGDQSMPD